LLGRSEETPSFVRIVCRPADKKFLVSVVNLEGEHVASIAEEPGTELTTEKIMKFIGRRLISEAHEQSALLRSTMPRQESAKTQ
jgi:hypothetical protein